MKKYLLFSFASCALLLIGAAISMGTEKAETAEEKTIRLIYDNALMKSDAYENLRYLTKRIGGRLAGPPQAAAAVEWGHQTIDRLGIDTVYRQACMVPHWERGEKEEARIISKLIGFQEVNICALGGSIATPSFGITAPIVEVKHLDEVPKMNVKGKIVFLNHAFDDKLISTFDAYSGCVGGRYEGAPMVSKHGGVGFILRSLGNAIDEHPHTGNMAYEEGVERIPSAAISTKHAEYLSDLLENDDEATFYMKMNCQSYEDKLSYNVIGEIKGSEKPEEIIVVSGHLDAWDNGEGAHDDGAGVVQSIDVMRIFKDMNIQPKRTIRCVLWMNEENGTMGARTYAKIAKEKGENCILAIESDEGGFSPRGFHFDAAEDILDKRVAKMQNYKSVLQPYNIHVLEKGFSGVDIKFLKDQGTTCVGLVPDPQRYFDYHHTPNDIFENVNKRELELGAAAMASLIYLVDRDGVE